MIQHEVTLHLKRPVEHVFAFLANYQNLRTWQSDLIENEQLTEGPLRVGTRFREVRRTGPSQSEIHGWSRPPARSPRCAAGDAGRRVRG